MKRMVIGLVRVLGLRTSSTTTSSLSSSGRPTLSLRHSFKPLQLSPNTLTKPITMRFITVLAIAALFAGQTLAQLEIVLGAPLGNLTASQILKQSDIDTLNCDSSCSNVQAAFQTCTDTNVNCLCQNSTIVALQSCEQCMFTSMINSNIKPPSPLAGSSAVLTAYAGATGCNHTETFVLTTPPGFLGTFEFELATAPDAVVVTIGGLLGLSALLLLCNIS